MFAWWQELNSVLIFNHWMLTVSIISAAATFAGLLLLNRFGNQMVSVLTEREYNASRKIKAVEKAAEQIRKELLATQQNQDIANQRRQLAEMDAGALRKELERTHQQYAEAEVTLKDRIGELRTLNITNGASRTKTTGLQTGAQSTSRAPTAGSRGSASRTATTRTASATKTLLNSQQKQALSKMLTEGPKGELDIICVLDNAESLAMARELKAHLDHHGWSIRDIVQSAFSSPPQGLVLVIHSKQTAPSYAKFLQRTLATLGLTVSAQINDKYPEWSISLIVGLLKP